MRVLLYKSLVPSTKSGHKCLIMWYGIYLLYKICTMSNLKASAILDLTQMAWSL